MANEISMTLSFAVNKSGTSISSAVSKQATMSGDAKISNTQNIGTSTEALQIGDITDLGYMYVQNLDATNFVQFSLTTPVTAGNAFAKLLPGEAFFVPCRNELIYGLADTSACNAQVTACSL